MEIWKEIFKPAVTKKEKWNISLLPKHMKWSTFDTGDFWVPGNKPCHYSGFIYLQVQLQVDTAYNWKCGAKYQRIFLGFWGGSHYIN